MIVPIILGFAGSYAAAFVVATALHAGSPWVVTLALGTALFAIVVFLARRNRQEP